MMSKEGRLRVWALIVALLIGSAALSEVLKPGHEQYLLAGRASKVGDQVDAVQARSALRDTPFSALVPTLFGMREVMASLMWVRADDYFHRGEYRPILSMVKQITTIDPHQIDVYATGAWHMAYNFMDKRLIADGVEFLEEGCENNPTVYDLFFELGYMHYDKTKDYPSAVAAYAESAQKERTTGKKHAPSYVRHQWAHATERSGNIDAAIERWASNLAVAQRLLDSKEEVDTGASGANIQAAHHNLYITSRRRNERLAAIAERERNAAEALRLWQANVSLADGWLAKFPGHAAVAKDRQVAQNHVERLRAGKLNPVAPANLDLRFTVTRIAPRQIEVKGTLDVLNLSRVHIRFHDKDYENRSRPGGTYDVDYKMANCTMEWDNIPVNKGQFKHVLNLNRDPADMERHPSEIYPLKAEEYELTLIYNPRLQAAFIQDRYGWHGEGLTASPDQLWVDPTRAGIMEGKRYPLRLLRRKLILKREDIVGEGKKVLAKI